MYSWWKFWRNALCDAIDWFSSVPVSSLGRTPWCYWKNGTNKVGNLVLCFRPTSRKINNFGRFLWVPWSGSILRCDAPRKLIRALWAFNPTRKTGGMESNRYTQQNCRYLDEQTKKRNKNCYFPQNLVGLCGPSRARRGGGGSDKNQVDVARRTDTTVSLLLKTEATVH